MDKQILDEYSLLHLLEYTQKYQGTHFHPEGGKDSDLNESIDDIKTDLETINSIIKDTGYAIEKDSRIRGNEAGCEDRCQEAFF